jgi:hypothetical protein
VSANKENAVLVGVGAAACAVCCAGPILGFLAAIGVGAAFGFALFGLVGLVVAVLVGVVLDRRRRQRRAKCAPIPQTVDVESPTVRVPR